MIKFLLKVIFCSLLLVVAKESIAGAETISDDKLTFNFAKTNWQLPNGKYSLSKEKTPDGEDVLLVTVDGKNTIMGGANFDQEKIRDICSDWKRWSLWIKPDGSAAYIMIIFISDNPGGKKKLAYHTAKINLLGKKWNKIDTNGLWPSNNKKFKISNFRAVSIHIITSKQAKFLVGPLTFALDNNRVRLHPLKVQNASRIQKAPLIDGKLDDNCWENASVVKDFIHPQTGGKAFPAEVKICYDSNNLYVASKQWRDTSKMRAKQTAPKMRACQDSCFEFFISPNNSLRTSYQYIVNKLNTQHGISCYYDQVKDDFKSVKGRYNAKWQSATHVEKDFWTVELKIPFSDTTPIIKADSILGMQIYLEGTGVWSNTKYNPNTRNFGVLNLLAEKNKAQAKVKLKNVRLFLGKKHKTPDIQLFLNSNAKTTAEVFLSNLERFIAKKKAQIVGGKKVIRLDDYRPASGSQRLTVALEENSGRNVSAFRIENIVFSHGSPYGKNVLCPAPKQFKKQKGTWNPKGNMKIYATADALKIAERVKKELDGYLQVDLPIAKTFLPGKWTIAIAQDIDIFKSTVKGLDTATIPKAEGYYLQIEKDNIIIKGKDAPGLFYGATTLSQLERYAFLRNDNFLGKCIIKDWPDMQKREWGNWTQALLLRKTKSSYTELMNTFMDHLDRVAIGSKMNMFMWNIPCLVQYEKDFNQPVRMWTKGNFISKQNLRHLAEHCKNNYTEFVPAGEGGGHALWMTLPYPELVMPGYSNWDANPLHPNYYKVVFSAFDEIIEAAKPKTFHIWHDEWWHQLRGKTTTKYKGIEKRDIFFKEVMTLYKYFKSKNIRITMCTDMLQRGHNGGLPYNNYLNLEKLPRDIIMTPWSGGIYFVEKLTNLGFDVIVSANRFKLRNASKLKKLKKVIGLMFVNYGYMKPDLEYGFTSLIRGADYAWNIYSGDDLSIDDWLFAKSQNIMALYSVLPNPNAGRTFKCINLDKYFNDSYSKSKKTELEINSLSGGKSKIGFVPMQLGDKSAKDNCIVGSSTPTVIPVDKTASSVIFLHTQVTPKEGRPGLRLKGRNYCDGVRTGKYVVNYNDGTNSSFYMRNAMNCGNWLPYRGVASTEIESKYLLDCRYTWSGQRQKEGSPCLYQYEWVNPYPQKTIKNIVFSSTGTEATPILFGITLRDVK